MIFTETPLKGCYTISLQPSSDNRGWFARTYCKNEFKAIGHTADWVQINHSFTVNKGTLRGLHFQLQPFTEIKLIRCIAGAVLDIIVDIRKNSPTFLQSFALELTATNNTMIYIPQGFAHGFQSLENNTALVYHHSQFYQPNVEGGIRYNDPAINLNWPLPIHTISTRDNEHPLLTSNFKGI